MMHRHVWTGKVVIRSCPHTMRGKRKTGPHTHVTCKTCGIISPKHVSYP